MQANVQSEEPYQQMQIRPQTLVVTILLILLIFWLLNTEILPKLYPEKVYKNSHILQSIKAQGIVITAENVHPRGKPIKMADDKLTYTFKRKDSGDGAVKYDVAEHASPDVSLSFHSVLQLLKRQHAQFSHEFYKTLQHGLGDGAGAAYFFETPPVMADSIHSKTFEFVLTAAHMLNHVQPDADAFSEYFPAECPSVASFLNLGGDARLVSPCQVEGTPPSAYTHLARFMNQASHTQISSFWSSAASEMLSHVEKQAGRSVWMSTSGAGVYWLHLRLDSRPKYYTYSPYRNDS